MRRKEIVQIINGVKCNVYLIPTGNIPDRRARELTKVFGSGILFPTKPMIILVPVKSETA